MPADSSAQQTKPTAIEEKIKALEADARQQDINDAKLQLASLTKIYGDVSQIEQKYKQEYPNLVIQEQQSENYARVVKEKLQDELTESERNTILGVAKDEDDRIAGLKSDWIQKRDRLPDLQAVLLRAQTEFADAETEFKEYADYKSAQKQLAARESESGKQMDAENYRGAFFLVSDMDLTAPVPPAQFNVKLEEEALELFDTANALRKAKTDFDLASAEAQKARKLYEDAEAKRIANILKLIAEADFSGEDSDEDGPGEGDTSEYKPGVRQGSTAPN